MSFVDYHLRSMEVRRYHELSKHRLDQYAPGPEFLDWANQPEAFRWFTGTHRLELGLRADQLQTSYGDLRRAVPLEAAPMNSANIGMLLEMSLGLAAWKAYGATRWAVRCNPSSGNLHPTEAYLGIPALPDLEPGIFHYLSRDHVLEQRTQIEGPVWRDALQGNLLLVLTSIHWREAWKYGVRAYRYCQLDAGHALAALAYGAAALGWRSHLLTAPGDRELGHLVGIDREPDFADAEGESADLALVVGPHPEAVDVGKILSLTSPSDWHGRANRLSAAQLAWPQIDLAHRNCRKPPSLPSAWTPAELPPLTTPAHAQLPASTLFRMRRSARAFDGRTPIDADTLFDLLETLLPRPNTAPWACLPWEPSVHPILFLHRVKGLAPGLYAFPRTAAAARRLQEQLSHFRWEQPAGCPAHLPLFLLASGDFSQIAAGFSCYQDLAGDAAFAMALLGDFKQSLDGAPWGYRYLHWEAGMLGQLLYLEAEANGFRGTGIGCFFDDAFHQWLGLTDNEWQDLYHFTVGTPVGDSRLETLPPYGHLGNR